MTTYLFDPMKTQCTNCRAIGTMNLFGQCEDCRGTVFKTTEGIAIGAVAGLNVGDLVIELGAYWKVTTVEKFTVFARPLNWFERVKLGFKQWREKRKSK